MKKIISHIAQNKIDDVFYALVRKVDVNLYDLPKLFDELQKIIFGANYFSHADRKKLDGM